MSVVSASAVTCVVVVADESEARKLVSPEYVATMPYDPAVAKVYWQLGLATVMSATVHSVFVPSVMVTEPVGLPAPGALTTTPTVKVTMPPVNDGL